MRPGHGSESEGADPLVQPVQQIPRLLGRPRPERVRGDAEDVLPLWSRAVRHASVDSHQQPDSAGLGWTEPVPKTAAPGPSLPLVRGRFRRQWQVSDSNQRRLSRGFYRGQRSMARVAAVLRQCARSPREALTASVMRPRGPRSDNRSIAPRETNMIAGAVIVEGRHHHSVGRLSDLPVQGAFYCGSRRRITRWVSRSPRLPIVEQTRPACMRRHRHGNAPRWPAFRSRRRDRRGCLRSRGM